ncbi:MAG TPA: thioredoxin family protein [Candidatus Angelobacter sp.]
MITPVCAFPRREGLRIEAALPDPNTTMHLELRMETIGYNQIMARMLKLLSMAGLLLCCLLSSAQWKKTPLQAPAQPNPQLYRSDANAAAEINHALITASKQHKRVLLDFGGNWCLDCHVLDRAFHQPRIAPLLDNNFVLVHVDVGQYDKNLDLAKKYRVNLEKGVPSLAVLSPRGAVLYSTFDFERARVMSEEDVIAFLDRWKPPATAKQTSR